MMDALEGAPVICVIHDGTEGPSDAIYTVCPRCIGKARNLLANFQLEIDSGLLDPTNPDDPAVAAFRILLALIPGKATR